MVLRQLLLLALLAIVSTPQADADSGHGTFSIVAFDSLTNELGIAVQSRAFSVGAGVPWAEANVGAIATQSATNESFGPRGLALMRSGLNAQETLKALIASDAGRENRQVGVVDSEGGSAAHTGGRCSGWAGDTTSVGLSVQGNILASPAVVADMVAAYSTTQGELAERLLAALRAGQAAGGDKRGQQSAALLVVRPSKTYPEYRTRYIELRVEDHVAPIVELERLFRMHQAQDLLEAHLRYAAQFDSLGLEEAANRERQRIGEALRQTLSRDDVGAGTLNALAWSCATADMYLEESLKAARRAVELDPQNTGILDTLAEVQFRLNRHDDAIATIKQALALEPADPYLLGQLKRFRQE